MNNTLDVISETITKINNLQRCLFRLQKELKKDRDQKGEDIQNSIKQLEEFGVFLDSSNYELRIKIFKSGLKYREIADEMGISPVWLSRTMKNTVTEEMRRRIETAINALLERKGLTA